MKTKDTGGPAFPTQEQRFPDGEMNVEATYGMNLRDYFAAKAMQGICQGRSHVNLRGHALASAKVAYEIADAMLEARAQ